jgi:hypothetical protein
MSLRVEHSRHLEAKRVSVDLEHGADRRPGREDPGRALQLPLGHSGIASMAR